MQGQALIVGVGADLPVTVQDATGLANILTDESRCHFAQAAVKLLTEGAATRAAVLSGLDTMATMPADATAIIYFSGHGYQVESSMGLSYYLMPNGYDVRKLYQTAISSQEFAAKLAAIPAKRLLLLLDCCHAGGLAYDNTKALDLTLTKAPLPPESATLFAQGSGRIVIASSRADEVSLVGTPYSLFTRALIDGLAGQGVAQLDGYVRALDLAFYAREMVPGWSKGRQHPLAEIAQADNFVIAHYANGEKNPRPLNLPPVQAEEVERANPPLPAAQFGPLDLRYSQGANIGNTGAITQHFGPQINNSTSAGGVET
ncbi:MAG: caspase family protein [Caldilineaceae bacterium]